MDIPNDRPTALALGLKYYNGNVCKHCKTTVKRVKKYDCYRCHMNSKKNYKTDNWFALRKSHKRLREASVKQAFVPWADRSKITEIYSKARLEGLHVDHIVPLKNPLVCGLHNEFNLQLMDPIENIKKSNHFVVS
jgi:hypothetical protein